MTQPADLPAESSLDIAKLFEEHRKIIVHSPILAVRGVPQEEQGVRTVRARTFAAPDPGGGAAYAWSHDFH